MYEDKCYKKTYLTQVVLRIDFVTPIAQIEKSLSPKLVKNVIAHFPIAEPPAENILHHVQIAQESGLKSHETRTKEWNFFGKDREKRLSISGSAIFVEYNRYKTYDKLKEEFENIITVLEREYPNNIAQRFGLRYVNHIEIDGVRLDEFEKYVTHKLITGIVLPDRKEHLTRIFHIVGMKFGDLEITFQYGVPNQDYPAVIKRPVFILDIDAYVQIGHQLGESLKYMDEAHGHIQALFETSITDSLRRKMNG